MADNQLSQLLPYYFQTEEEKAAVKASCEDLQRGLLAAEEEIEALKRAVEAERAKERGAKDCVALQHAHMEGLRMALNQALEAENESHSKLL